MHLNDFNLKMQGETLLTCDLYSKVKHFHRKLTLFDTQLARGCEKYKQEAATPFPTLLAQDAVSYIKQQFQERFSDLDAYSLKIRLFKIPFDSVIEDLSIDLQMEIIDLQSNDVLNDKFKEGNLIEFYKCLPSEQYSYLKKFSHEFISAFSTTYLCQKTFSRMKYTKSCYRLQLSDERLNS